MLPRHREWNGEVLEAMPVRERDGLLVRTKYLRQLPNKPLFRWAHKWLTQRA
jgi:hypothetical protein